jgi:hypothetical protein
MSDPQLTDEQIDAIAEKAAAKALEKVYTEVGKSVVTKLMWIVGVGAIALLYWLASIGELPKP